MSLLLGGSIAVVVSRRSVTRGERRLRSTLDGFFMLPLGVSAVTLGFGFLITLDQPPFDLRDSPLLVPVAQALVALPLVVRTLVPVLSGIDDRQRQAAASLGAGPLRGFATVDLPVVWRPLLAAAGFAFAVSLGEFGATSFLARDEHPTLPVVIYQLIGRPGSENFGMALAASVVLAAATALVVLVVDRLGVRSRGGAVMLTLTDVSVSYDGTPAVRDASLELPDGQVLAVLGPSGCGKSTLLRAVAGLEPLVAGTVAWDGSDLERVPTHKRGFALMFQDGQLFNHLTVAAQHRLRPAAPALLRHRGPGRGAAGPGRPGGVRRPAADHAVRRRTAARRPGPLPRRTPPAAAARRTPLRPRRRAPPPARDRPARDPHPGGDHRADGHPRPRGGVHRRRPAGGDAGRRDRPAGRDRRGLARTRRPPDRALPRLRPRARGCRRRDSP